MAAIPIESATGQRFRTLADSFPKAVSSPAHEASSRQRPAPLERDEQQTIPLPIHYGSFNDLSNEQREVALAWASDVEHHDVTKSLSSQLIAGGEKIMQVVPYGLRRFFFRDPDYEAHVETLRKQQQQKRKREQQERQELKETIAKWNASTIPARPRTPLNATEDSLRPVRNEGSSIAYAYHLDAGQAKPTVHAEAPRRKQRVSHNIPIYPQTQDEIKAYAATLYKSRHREDFRTLHEISQQLFPERNTREEYGGYVKALIVKVVNQAGNHLPEIVRDKAVELFRAIPAHIKVRFAEDTDYRTIDGFSNFISKIYHAFTTLLSRAQQHHSPLPQDLTINIA